ncbi:phage antirepressor N-terminal domain-containing protein [Salinisphaera sp. T31B1]|uniref:phage antirepressor N-terminal domain-containing protein n=1 Tax=Salinisphaera sp. T31B1 TaxID=727963 RepID=UPI0033415FB4
MSDVTTSVATDNVRSRTGAMPSDVAFHGQAISTFNDNGVIRVAMKPVCEGIGLNWRAQYNRIKRHAVLSPCVVVMTTQVGAQSRKLVTLPLSKLNGWLFGVDASRVRPEVRDRLIEYQSECFDVLANYWNVGVAINPRVTDSTIGTDGFNVLHNLVAQRTKKIAGPSTRCAKSYLWSMVHARFNVRRADQIPADSLEDACNFIASCTLDGEFIPAPNKQPAPHDPTEFLRSALGPSIAGLRVDHSEGRQRWLVSLESDHRIQVNPLSPFVAIIRPDSEAEVRTIVDEYIPYKMLPSIISAAADRLSRIAEHRLMR